MLSPAQSWFEGEFVEFLHVKSVIHRVLTMFQTSAAPIPGAGLVVSTILSLVTTSVLVLFLGITAVLKRSEIAN